MITIDSKNSIWERMSVTAPDGMTDEELLKDMRAKLDSREIENGDEMYNYLHEVGATFDREIIYDSAYAMNPEDNEFNSTLEVFDGPRIGREPVWTNDLISNSTQHTIVFTREEGIRGVTHVGMCSFRAKEGDSMQILKGAVTRWMNETEEGKTAYEDSSEDFNIGDLALYQYKSLLWEYGVYCLCIETGQHYETYDTHLKEDS